MADSVSKIKEFRIAIFLKSRFSLSPRGLASVSKGAKTAIIMTHINPDISNNNLTTSLLTKNNNFIKPSTTSVEMTEKI